MKPPSFKARAYEFGRRTKRVIAKNDVEIVGGLVIGAILVVISLLR